MKRGCARRQPSTASPARGAKTMQTALIALLRFYKVAVSPLLGNRCRFYPSCSDYAREAIQYHGAAHGTYLAVKRLCRCHPLSAGGVDLVPPPNAHESSADAEASGQDKLSTLNGAEALSDRH
ncbi:membrane protein insertion efficiency factor YidD [Caballeronia novacaledonica]|uniref:Putative membrane protein insertion efficiency factor n=2 Tax=Caballeronia novacaledonica TaxID=1544861 RepID=A0A2U3I2H9_9BURK|nr:membrane protein insertion efficiency factor YidD [Caballeronia novacaledonica]